MLLRFSKMHGLGNDFMVVDLITQRVYLNNEQIKNLADRHFGVGFDQLLLVEPPSSPDMDFRYRIFNADGSEVENCGNGARCFARFVLDRHLTTKRRINVETAGGPLTLTVEADGRVVVDMGKPILEAARVPFIALPEELQTAPVHTVRIDERINGSGNIVATGTAPINISNLPTDPLQVGVVSMGNPHAVIMVDSVETAPVETLGPLMEKHPRFPNRVNVGFMQVVDRQHIRLRVFERGVGETLACGTGACAAVVSGIQQGILDSEVNVDLPGGRLTILWQGDGHHVMMIGPATKVFEGRLDL